MSKITVAKEEIPALQMIIDYYNNEFDLDYLHDSLKKYFGDIKRAVNFLSDYDEVAKDMASKGKSVVESKKLTESKDDNVIWRSDAEQDFIWYGDINEVIEAYGLEDEVEEGLSEDELRDRAYDEYIDMPDNLDYEDLKERVIPMISKQCYNDYIWFIGTYKTWQKSNDAIGFYTDAEKGIEKVCYPGYDNTSVLYTDDKGEIVWTEYSHDAPMGGSDMKLYSFKDKAAFDRAVEIADEMYEEEEGSTFKDDYGYYQDVDDVAEWSDWLNRVIDEGLLTGIPVQW